MRFANSSRERIISLLKNISAVAFTTLSKSFGQTLGRRGGLMGSELDSESE